MGRRPLPGERVSRRSDSEGLSVDEPVYVVARIDVKDQQTYMEEYGVPVLNQLAEAGAEVLVGSADAEVLEGEWPGNWTVVIRFPNAETASRWYNSREYAPLKSARIEQLSNSGSIVLVPGFNAEP